MSTEAPRAAEREQFSIVKPESCCCADGEAMCIHCMQGDHRYCFDKALARYRTPEDRIAILEQKVAALEARFPGVVA